MHKAGQQYGPVVGLYLGKRKSLIVTGFEEAKEILNRDEFSSRPYSFIAQHMYNDQASGKQTNRFMSKSLFSSLQQRKILQAYFSGTVSYGKNNGASLSVSYGNFDSVKLVWRL